MKDAISGVPGIGNVKGIADAYLQPEIKDTPENKKARRQALMAYLDQLVKLQQPPGEGSTQPAPTPSESPAGPAAAFTPGAASPVAAPGSPPAGGAPAGGPTASADNKRPNTGGFSTEPATGQLGEAEGKQQAVKVANRLMQDFGLTKEQAAGVAGNLYHESAGMNSNVNEFGSDPNGQPFGPPNGTQFGYGWAQWTGDRKTAYLDYSKSIGLDPSSPAANYAMLSHELSGSEAGTLDALKSTSTPEDAAVAFRKVFERAANPVDEKRIAAAREIYSLM